MQPRYHVVPVTLLVYILFSSAFFSRWTVDAAKTKTTKTTNAKKTKTTDPPQDSTEGYSLCGRKDLVEAGCLNGATCKVKSSNVFLQDLKNALKPNSKNSPKFDYKKYQCVCAVGHTGTKCEKLDTGSPTDNYTPCDTEEMIEFGCRNGGSCQIKQMNKLKKVLNFKSKESGGFVLKCKCTLGFEGPKCEKAVCKKEICNKRGKCHVIRASKTKSAHSCDCKPPYGGLVCNETLKEGEEDKAQHSQMVRDTCKKRKDCFNGKCLEIKSNKKFDDQFNGTKYQNLIKTGVVKLHNLSKRYYICRCDLGYDGPYCTKKCPTGWWGRWCSNKCSQHCKKPGECDSKKGQCKCQKGFGSSTCALVLPCEDGMTCIHGSCDKVNTCACSSGYFGQACDQKCKVKKGPPYLWGAGCTRNCSEHCLIKQCDGTNGNCMANNKGDRCEQGWGGLDCENSIPEAGEIQASGAVNFIAKFNTGRLEFNLDIMSKQDINSLANDLKTYLEEAAEAEAEAQRLDELYDDGFADDEFDDDYDDDDVGNEFPAAEGGETSTQQQSERNFKKNFLTETWNWFKRASKSSLKALPTKLRQLKLRIGGDTLGQQRKRRQDDDSQVTMDFTLGYPLEVAQERNVKAGLTSALKETSQDFKVPGLTVDEKSVSVHTVELVKFPNPADSKLLLNPSTMQSAGGVLIALIVISVGALFIIKRRQQHTLTANRKKGHKPQVPNRSSRASSRSSKSRKSKESSSYSNSSYSVGGHSPNASRTSKNSRTSRSRNSRASTITKSSRSSRQSKSINSSYL